MRRASCQGAGDLEAFYDEVVASDDPDRACRGRAMKAVLAGLEPIAARYRVWGLTSLEDLVILGEDDYRAYNRIRVSFQSWCHVYVVLMRVAPRETELVGRAATASDAVRMVERALESGGWAPIREPPGR